MVPIHKNPFAPKEMQVVSKTTAVSKVSFLLNIYTIQYGVVKPNLNFTELVINMNLPLKYFPGSIKFNSFLYFDLTKLF